MEEQKKDLSIFEKLDNLAKNLVFLAGEYNNIAKGLDNVYLQLCTLIEILGKKEIINDEIWESTLAEVADALKKQVEEAINAKKGSGETDNEANPDGTDETAGSSKIITPNSGIIIPGQA